MRVLLVDDDDGVRLSMSIVLEDEARCEVVACATAADATRALTDGAYDVVLLDQHLGDARGSDLVPHVRRAQPGARVLLLTGDAASADASLFDAVTEKGVDPRALIALMRSGSR